jgi:hypothetical protein
MLNFAEGALVADLSTLSTEDLIALKGGDLSKVSTAGLQALKGLQSGPSAAERIATDPTSTGTRATAGATPAELIAGSAPGRFLLESARGLLELGSHLGLPGGESAQQTGELIKRGRAAYGDTGLDIAGIAGQVASPAVLGAAKLIPAGAKLLPRALGSMAVGATAGATTPTADKGDFWKEKGMQTGTGAALGAALPPAGALAKGLFSTGYRAFEPMLPGGAEAILGRYRDKLLGPAKEKVAQALMDAKELVPGSLPTAGEAIAGIPGATGLAAHQKIVSKTPPAAAGFVTREQEQEAARAAALGGVAKTPAELAAAEAARAGEAATNYGKAFAETTRADPTLAKLAEDPFFKEALPEAIKIAASKGINAKDNLTQFLHYVKEGLDTQLGATAKTPLSREGQRAVQDVKARLNAWMDEKNPAYGYARRRFADLSRPINEMQVGQALQEKLTAPLGASERAASFASTIRSPESLIKSEVGGPTRKLEDLLTPEQFGAIQGVGSDLGRKAQFERLARGTNLSGADMTPESLLPNLLYRPAMATNWVAKRMGHDLMDKINTVAGRQYLNPQELAASLMDKPISVRKRLIDELLQRTGYPIVSGGPSAAVAQQY